MPLKYVMRAYKTTPTTGLVYWEVNDAPDPTGAQSGYSPSDLENIIINATYEIPIPTSGIQFAALIENPASQASFQRITSDMVFPPFVVTVGGSLNLEVNQTVTPSFTASYTGSTPISAVLSNNFDGYTVTGISPFTSFNTSAYAPDNVYQKTSYGQSIVFTVTANNGSVTKTGTATLNWLQKVFYGVGVAGQSSEAFIESLGTSVITSTRARTITLNGGTSPGLKVYYAHRTGFGLIDTASSNVALNFSVGGIAGGFSNTATVSITNAYGFTENYYLYESDNLIIGSITVGVP
jgi:hypothetical protein